MCNCEYFKNKKITLMGLGVLGRGVGDAVFLAECGAELIVTDIKTEPELKESVSKLGTYKNISFALGGHSLKDFKNRDMIIQSAGAPFDSPYIAEARKNNIPIEMSTALFAALSGAYIIGITGTRGKSTVTHLLYGILQRAGKRVHLGGNVRGVSTLAQLPNVRKGDYAVLELDSWQLQGFGERKISPNMAIFTNILPDHLNYYHGDMNRYIADKEHIFLHQKKDDILIVGKKMSSFIKGRPCKSTIYNAENEMFPSNWKMKLLGEHNRENCAIAIIAARALSVPDEIIQEAVENFDGVPGRLELLRIINGVKIYNDTTATTPDATLVAVAAVGKNKNIILIMGGADKLLDMSELVKEIPKHCKAVILLPGTGTIKIKNQISTKQSKLAVGRSKIKITVQNAKSLKEAVDIAQTLAENGDVILFSPAFASFGLFKNEFDRGEQFNKLVDEL